MFFFEKKTQVAGVRLVRTHAPTDKSLLLLFFRKEVLASFFACTQALASPLTVGPQPDGSILASSNQLLTPVGRVVPLGSPARAKAVCLNPVGATAAVLLMKASQPIVIISTKTGAILQRFAASPARPGARANTTGAIAGLAYTPDGSKLLFSQDGASASSGGAVTIANVDPATGLLTASTSVALPPLTGIAKPFKPYAVNPAGIAVSDDGKTALVALNAQNSVGMIDIPAATLVAQIPVGNAPNQIAIMGNSAFVTNEGGRAARAGDFTDPSDGTPIVADPHEAFATTGTVSVIDLATRKVTHTIDVGLHPAGIHAGGNRIFVASSYSDTISVIDPISLKITRTIPITVPLAGSAFGAGVNDAATVGNFAYVTLGQSNAIAVVDLAKNAVAGYIPTLYFPTTIAYDSASQQLLVSNDKGLGAQGATGTAQGLSAYNTHQDSGAVTMVRVPDAAALAADTEQVYRNNNWRSPHADPGTARAHMAAVAVPARPGEPSLIRHVFLIVKENRTYDQILGDLKQGNGDASLAIFANATPNQHALVKRFPLLDNIYAPSRQSADGHPWIFEAGSFYSNDILSPDWIRSYPGGDADDALTYTQRGFLWSEAERRGMNVKLYGEWSSAHNVAAKPDGTAYSWADFYNTHLHTATNGKQGSAVVPAGAITESSNVPSADAILDRHYPAFDLTIPDQNRADIWIAAFANQLATNSVPAFSIIWLPDDHTAGVMPGLPLPVNYQADNDLALGRIVEAISHSTAWPGSAIFVEEDDAQNGVDHVDGHRQPVYVISPYTEAPQAPGIGRVIHTTYTQLNIDRTIENILGLQPLTQFDRVAAPMFDVFQNTPDLTPFTHVPATIPLNIGPGGTPIAGTGGASTASLAPLQKAWSLAAVHRFAGRLTQADAVDAGFLDHLIWYSATNWVRPYPGDKSIAPP